MMLRPWRQRLGVGSVVALLLGLLAPAQATAVSEPEYPTPHIAYVRTAHEDDGPKFTFGRIRTMRFGVKDAVASTTVTLKLFGCNDAPIGTFAGTGEGTFDVIAELDEAAQNAVGNIRFLVTWSAPGYAPATREGSVTHPNPEVAEQICAGTFVPTVAVDPPNVKVTSWSKKSGRAKVGRTVRVTPTIAPEAQVRYDWNLKISRTRGKHLGNAATRSVKIRPWMKGGKLSVQITADRDGYDMGYRFRSFGTVR